MKKTFTITAALISTTSMAWSGTAYNIATHSVIPGKHLIGYCSTYASELKKKIDPIAEACVVVYDWEQNGSSGCHAVVMFKDDHRWFMVDNETNQPKWVEGKTLAEKILTFSPNLEKVTVRNIY